VLVGCLLLNASNISQMLGNFSTGDSVTSSAAVVGGVVYVGSDDLLYALNASNISQMLSNFSTGSFFRSSPAVVGGVVYVGSHDNSVYALGTYRNTSDQNDIRRVSLSNNDNTLFAYVETSLTMDVSDESTFTRMFITTDDSSGNSSTPEGNVLPFSYDYLIQVNGSTCYVFNYTDYSNNISGCSFASSSNTLEIGVPLGAFGTPASGDNWNVTFETASSTERYDIAPDIHSFISFTLGGDVDLAAPSVSGLLVTTPIQNGTAINVSANVTDINTISTVKALLKFPNGTNYVNITMDNVSGGSNYYNDTYILDVQDTWGNFSVTIYAEDNSGNSDQSQSAQFIPYFNISQNTSITIDGSFNDWDSLKNFTDVVGDSLDLTNFINISSGEFHSCGLFSNGSAFCWGQGSDGQLGYGGNDSHNSPVAVNISPNNFSVISAGERHSCGVLVNGSAFCWGWGSSGQLGYGGNDSQNSPVAVNISPNNFSVISLTLRHSCGVLSNGSAFCWGLGALGRLGYGGTDDKYTPIAVNISPNNFTSISAGVGHSCGLLSNGSAFCWGQGGSGRLGYGGTSTQNVPVAVNITPNNFSVIYAGRAHSCGIVRNGSLFCWGAGSSGRLGYGGTDSQNSPVAVNISPNDFSVISAGGAHSCGVLSNGSAFCWGEAGVGQSGYGGLVDQYSPVAVNISPNDFSVISAGEIHSCGVLVNGPAYCWGNGGNGRLGYGGTSQQNNPILVNTSGISANNFEIRLVSIANDNIDLFGLFEDDDSVDTSRSDEFYRIYISTSSAGNVTTPENNTLPFAYDYRIQVNGSECYVFNWSDYSNNVSGCSFASNSNTLEIGVPLTAFGTPATGDTWNVTFETASSTQRMSTSC